MSFGKRVREPTGWLDQKEPINDSHSDVSQPRSGGGGGGNLNSIAKGIGGILMVVGLVFGVKALLAEALIGHLKDKPKQVASADFAKVADLCTPMKESVNYMPTTHDLEFADVAGRVRSPRFLNCVMTHHQDRLCQAGERATLATDIKNYVRYVEAKQIQNKFAHDFRQKNPNNIIVQLSEPQKPGGITTGADTIEVDRRVVVNAQELIRKGYLSAADFGWSMPKSVERILEGIKAEERNC